MKYRIAIAGSTAHTVQCAQALQSDPRFEIAWILTPTQKTVGRKKVVTKNPLHLFADQQNIPVILFEQKIDDVVHAKIQSVQSVGSIDASIDFLFVVDFGYLVPDWLLALPRIAPLNVHPSALPRWRGSAPGQFVLLYGEHTSAVTLMVMNAGLDTGPILFQQPLTVDTTWTQTEYYAASFAAICRVLADTIIAFAEKKIPAQSQPENSPTPLARRLTKEDSFVSWQSVQSNQNDLINPLLTEVSAHAGSWPYTLANATRAFNPWPTLWTLIPTANGDKRMQILHAHVDDNGKFILDTVKIEGQSVAKWAQVKNQVSA